MNNTNQKFKVELENGDIVDAELLTVVELDGTTYAIYSIDNPSGTVDLLASYVIKDSEGYDELVDITNPLDKEKIFKYIKNLMA